MIKDRHRLKQVSTQPQGAEGVLQRYLKPLFIIRLYTGKQNNNTQNPDLRLVYFPPETDFSPGPERTPSNKPE